MTSRLVSLVAGLGLVATSATAQTVGTFRWQLQPYCNIITVTVTQVGAFYRLEGTDDRCGAVETSSVIGTAFANPDGTVGMGFNVVVAPGGVPQPVSAQVTLATLSGTWSDAQQAGQFVFTPAAGTGGSPRPVPTTASAIADAFRLQADGGFLAGGVFPVGTLPATGPGVRLMWAPAKAAIRAGRVSGVAWDEASIGAESAAFNRNTLADGPASFAANDATRAEGASSVAFGKGSFAVGASSMASGESAAARGPTSFASGVNVAAAGTASLAIGVTNGRTATASESATIGGASHAGQQAAAFSFSTATGQQSVAAGFGIAQSRSSVALANGSTIGDEGVAIGDAIAGDAKVVAIGYRTTSGNRTGVFYFGDRSTLTPPILPDIDNQFVVRATGDVGFYTNAPATTGVELAGGGGSWAPLSDARMKRRFRHVSGDALLRRLAGVPVREWNYVAQDAAIRHLGPTAQDFRSAFGLGDYPLRINTVDADGVALAAARAIETRTRRLTRQQADLAEEHDRLEARHASLLRERHALIERLRVLEARVER
jgi:hypothetical protein